MHRRMNSPSIALFKRIVVSERMTEHDLLDFESTQKMVSFTVILKFGLSMLWLRARM